MRYGTERASNPAAEHVKVDSFVAQYTSLPFDDRAAGRFGRVPADLHARGFAIGPFDSMIAAIARVPGFTLEVWDVP